MKLLFGSLLGLMTIIYWAALLKNIPHKWKVVHSKEWNVVHTNVSKAKLGVAIAFILSGLFGLFLLKWSAQLLEILY